MIKFMEEVSKAYRKKVLFTSHALDQMTLADRMISRRDACEVIEHGGIIENYPV